MHGHTDAQTLYVEATDKAKNLRYPPRTHCGILTSGRFSLEAFLREAERAWTRNDWKIETTDEQKKTEKQKRHQLFSLLYVSS